MLEALASALCWRYRGILGWPFTLLFALIQVGVLAQALGPWALIIAPAIMLWEPVGWKPKDWNLPAWTRWEPNVKFFQNPKAFKLPFWSDPKHLLDWRGAWIEVWFGLFFNLVVQVVAYGIRMA